MPWNRTRADRERDTKTYGSAEYRRNRAIARRRAGGRCEQCGHRHATLQCDHITPVTQGGTHNPDNLRMLCAGDGTCKCHEKKTATEGGGFRRGGGDRRAARDPEPRPRTSW